MNDMATWLKTGMKVEVVRLEKNRFGQTAIIRINGKLMTVPRSEIMLPHDEQLIAQLQETLSLKNPSSDPRYFQAVRGLLKSGVSFASFLGSRKQVAEFTLF